MSTFRSGVVLWLPRRGLMGTVASSCRVGILNPVTG